MHAAAGCSIDRVRDRASAVAELMQSDGGLPPHTARGHDHSDLHEWKQPFRMVSGWGHETCVTDLRKRRDQSHDRSGVGPYECRLGWIP
ncbi:hypothetical protein Stube_41360 [Streptomyces tubercidicus]|uniref:Uncharacterized protein n=1 Tax=Streptomyces tubercidicus TaxID=47759 RepID=A0A640UTV1_9ACTN|nr:hypothetical protein Stube_41360 [Streptomyces tubercidicus]